MKNWRLRSKRSTWCVLFLFFFTLSCGSNPDVASSDEDYDWKEHYTKEEIYVPMRDGIKLFTTVYTPVDTTQTYPLIIKRTPYSCRPYGKDTLPTQIHHNIDLVQSGYIFVVQDVRGRWMSEGDFENTKPPYSFSDSAATDEVTDSWDTFEWLAENLAHYNGNAGIYGTSYPGFQTLVGARSNHPSVKAAMPSAPVTNFYFEDFNRYGLYAMNYVPVIGVFGTPRPNPVDTAWWEDKSKVFGMNDSNTVSADYYDFFLDRMTLSSFGDVIDSTDFFWKNLLAHPDYDAYRQKRDWIQYLDEITCPIMVVGGWNDEQNLYGNINSYKQMIQSQNKENVQLLLGPWSHGHQTRGDSSYYLGNIFFGHELSKNFMENDEFSFFEYHLKENGTPPDYRVKLYDCGKQEWKIFEEYPDELPGERFYLTEDSLLKTMPEKEGYATYISDPFHPVPFLEGDVFHRMAPKSYFTADQRFTSKRPDVLTFTSPPLEEDMTVVGEVKAFLDFATNLKDADLYVKVIDVHPQDRTPQETDLEGIKMSGYQQLVRCGYIRGRYRNGFEKGEPFKSNKKTQVQVPLLDVFHTFAKGHQVMIQVQSSMFPLFDLNPQNYVEDITTAQKSDFASAVHRIYSLSYIDFPVLK